MTPNHSSNLTSPELHTHTDNTNCPTTTASMLPRAPLLRLTQRTALRSAIRRPYSAQGVGETGLRGPADNAFNRERAAVKHHAEQTSGEFLLTGFYYECNGSRADSTADLWRKLSI